jgi:hypothetical protein
MFENKKEPQDIFEGVEPPANLPVGNNAPAAPAPVAPTPTTPAAPPAPAAKPVVTAPTAAPAAPQVTADKLVYDRDLETGGHFMRTAGIVLVAFVVMGLAAFLAYQVMEGGDGGDENDRGGETAGDTDEEDQLPDGKGGGEDVLDDDVEIILDNDGDGLTNDEETAAGTSLAKPDTDSDLLGDKEEVQVYGTDPLRADTDGDGFNDGVEVSGGYNPNGPGKILEVPSN